MEFDDILDASRDVLKTSEENVSINHAAALERLRAAIDAYDARMLALRVMVPFAEPDAVEPDAVEPDADDELEVRFE